MYDIITNYPRTGFSITTRFSAEDGIWFTSDNPADIWNGSAIGEGKTPEDAIADYWYSFHDGQTASLFEPDEFVDERWRLFDGAYVQYFDSREEAVAYAEANQYLLNPFVPEA